MGTAKQATGGSGRAVTRVVPAVRTLEGAGFPVRRPFPTEALDHTDPFLLLDEMGPVDWAPGEAVLAPDHPHRGFETVTYVLAGKIAHKDSAGNAGVIGPGDVQWMTAGRGVVHSELYEDAFREAGGRAHGFQLWVNLPARDKMMAPRYQEVPRARIPVGKAAGVTARVIAGEALGVKAVIETRTPITYVHYTLAPGARTVQRLPEAQEGFIFVFAGSLDVGENEQRVADGHAGILGPGDSLALACPADGPGVAEALVIAGVPLREPVARYGPFVMNTKDEIRQAFVDFQSGQFAGR